MGLTESQEMALKTLRKGLNVFISGGPGTGKSYILDKFISEMDEAGKEVLVTAPTGVAAINIGGATLHRQFRVPIGPVVNKPKKLDKVLMAADVIIIDEIGMCRADVLDYVYLQLMAINKKRRDCGNRDIQVVVAGDFFQLPPIVTDREKEVLKHVYPECYNEMYAFQAKYWEYFGFVRCKLTEAVRQNELAFVNALEQARSGDRRSLRYFSANSNKNYIKNGILLCGTNKAVHDKNMTELNKLGGIEAVYGATVDGEVTDADKPAPEELSVKLGARVMVLINDREYKYCNGNFGEVVELGENYVSVKLDNSGLVIPFKEHPFEVKKFMYDSEKKKMMEKVIGTYRQLPLKLAYAVTIHKCQGQTYDAVNIDPQCWDRGQLYTAISRCKQISNVHFTKQIEPRYLVASSSVCKFYNLWGG